MPDEILIECHDGVGLITLNRPDQLNAFTPSMIDAWAGAIRALGHDEACRVVVVTGAGRAFCAGGDVKSLARRGQESAFQRKAWLWEHVQQVPLAMAGLDKPVLSAINGVAVGAGMDLALAADLRYCSADARLAETYVRSALVPGAGGAWVLPRLVGSARALEMLWLGDWVDPPQAERLGLVNRVLPSDELMPYVMRIARRLASGPSVAQRMIKRLVRGSADVDLRTHLDLVSSHMAVVAATSDHQEAVAARAAKREPVFTGR
jgi:2-(1,2-epoxy-1,2-dihydrophenyl)acetyl-CoA isomerase